MLHLDNATPASSPQNHTHVLVHWESCLQGLEIPATEPVSANLYNRDCLPEQTLCHPSIQASLPHFHSLPPYGPSMPLPTKFSLRHFKLHVVIRAKRRTNRYVMNEILTDKDHRMSR